MSAVLSRGRVVGCAAVVRVCVSECVCRWSSIAIRIVSGSSRGLRGCAKRVIVRANQKAECEARYRESQSKGRVRSALSIKRAFCTQRGALLWSLSISNRFQIDFKWDFNISVSISVMKRDWVLTHSQFLLWAARAPCLVRGGVCVEVCVCVCVCV